MKKSPPRITGELADKAFRYQMRVFRACGWAISIAMLLALVLLGPKGKAFFAVGPHVWYWMLLKLVVILVPGLLLVLAFAYSSFLIATALGVVLIRLLIPQLRMPDARSILLQFYSDPRWLNAQAGVYYGPIWKNKRLVHWCKSLAAVTISHVYGTYPGMSGSMD